MISDGKYQHWLWVGETFTKLVILRRGKPDSKRNERPGEGWVRIRSETPAEKPIMMYFEGSFEHDSVQRIEQMFCVYT